MFFPVSIPDVLCQTSFYPWVRSPLIYISAQLLNSRKINVYLKFYISFHIKFKVLLPPLPQAI